MVQVDLPAAFTIGQIYAILAKKYLKAEPDLFNNKLLGPLNLYLSCGFSVVGLFLLIAWPSWEVMYIGSWVEAPFNRPLVAGAYVLFLIVMVILGNVGFILGHHWLRKGKDRLVAAGAIAGGILTALPFLLRWGVWWRVGTYQDITTGAGYSFWQPPFFYGWLVVMSYLVLTTVWTGIWFWKRKHP